MQIQCLLSYTFTFYLRHVFEDTMRKKMFNPPTQKNQRLSIKMEEKKIGRNRKPNLEV